MTTQLGEGEHTYEELTQWEQLPAGWNLREVCDVVVDRNDRVYLFNRGEHPVIVLERDGSFVTSWGEGLFSPRPHGISLAADDTLLCVDDGDHTVRRCTLDGEVLETLGTPNAPAPEGSGEPFNRPCKAVVDPDSGAMFVADGYGNPKVHRFSAEGELRTSWGDYGTDPACFNLPHSVALDGDGRLFVADRENHRLQIFDLSGTFLDQWNNMHRPCGLHIHEGHVYVGELPTHLEVNESYPGLGARVCIYDLEGVRLATLGDTRPGEGPGQFTTPHGIAVDSRGDLYVAEVSWSAWGRRLSPPREARCFRKLIRL
jgi:DNA-binding beta-propeller fold protein YncE